MAKIGDRIKITMSGPAVLANTATPSGFSSIPKEAEITVTGRIITGVKDNWIIELDISLDGNNQMSIPKAIIEEKATQQ